MTLWIIFFAFAELYGVGVAVFAKRRNLERWALNFIPLYAFTFANRYTRGFKTLSIPVKKFFSCVVIELVVCALAYAFAMWGERNLNDLDAGCLKQIMYVPAGAAIGVFYLQVVKSTLAIAEEWRARFKLDWLVYMTLVAVPVAFVLLPVREKRNNAVGL